MISFTVHLRVHVSMRLCVSFNRYLLIENVISEVHLTRQMLAMYAILVRNICYNTFVSRECFP